MTVATLRVRADEAGWLERALAVLRAGGLVVFPTDTVYGVGALATDPDAVARIFAAKGRSVEKVLPVLVADWKAALSLVEPTPGAVRLATAFWPGPLTLVLPGRDRRPGLAANDGTMGVRAPDHPVALALLRAAGPLAATSANRSGEANPTTADQALQALEGEIELLIDAGRSPGGSPSTVVDAAGKSPRVLRQGPIGQESLLEAWSQAS